MKKVVKKTSCLILLAAMSAVSTVSSLSWAIDSIGEGIPADALLFGHWSSRPRQGIADRYLRGVREALGDSGVIDEFVQILGKGLEAGEGDHFRLEADYWKRILAEVGWWRLLSREVAFAVRLSPRERFEFIFLFRVGEPSRDATLLDLREILFGLDAVFNNYAILAKDRDGVPTTVLYDRTDGEQICIGGHGGVVAMTTSDQLLRESLKLLAGEGRGTAFVHSEKYFRAHEEWLAHSSGTAKKFGGGGTGSEPGPGAAASSFEFLFLPGDIFRENPTIDVLDDFHVLARFQADRILWDLRYRVKEGEDNVLSRAFARQGNVADLLRKVPRGVDAFAVEAGAEPESLYDYFFDLLGVLSGGPQLPGVLERSQGEIGLDLKRNVFHLLSGRHVCLQFSEDESDGEDRETLKDAGVSRVFLFELKKREGIRDEVKVRLAAFVAGLEKAGLKVDVTSVEGITGEFFRVSSEALLGWPIHFGATATEIVVATSAGGFQRALSVTGDEDERGEGSVRSIAGDPSLAEIWKLPQDRLDSVSYGSFAGDLAAVRSGLRLLGGLARFLPQRGEPGIVRPALIVLPRLQKAVRALEFLDRGLGYSLRDGNSYTGSGTVYLRKPR